MDAIMALISLILWVLHVWVLCQLVAVEAPRAILSFFFTASMVSTVLMVWTLSLLLGRGLPAVMGLS